MLSVGLKSLRLSSGFFPGTTASSHDRKDAPEANLELQVMCRRECESQSLFVSLCGPAINWQLHPELKYSGESENRKRKVKEEKKKPQ